MLNTGGENYAEITQQHFDHMFYLLDNMNGQQRAKGKIIREDFMKIFEVYELWNYEQ